MWVGWWALRRDVFECPHPVSPFIMFNSAKEETASECYPECRVKSTMHFTSNTNDLFGEPSCTLDPGAPPIPYIFSYRSSSRLCMSHVIYMHVTFRSHACHVSLICMSHMSHVVNMFVYKHVTSCEYACLLNTPHHTSTVPLSKLGLLGVELEELGVASGHESSVAKRSGSS